jgi:hypothetical protein
MDCVKPKDRIVESGEMVVTMERPVNTFPQQPNQVTATTDTHATTEELLEAVFSVWSLQKLYYEASWTKVNASQWWPNATRSCGHEVL